MKSKAFFGDEDIQEAFHKLERGKTEDKQLHNWISRAIDDIEENAFCGTQIAKKLIPKEYLQKYDIDNLWKYDLPSAWRLLYSVAGDEVQIISILLDWMDHKHYERKFKY